MIIKHYFAYYIDINGLLAVAFYDSLTNNIYGAVECLGHFFKNVLNPVYGRLLTHSSISFSVYFFDTR